MRQKQFQIAARQLHVIGQDVLMYRKRNLPGDDAVAACQHPICIAIQHTALRPRALNTSKPTFHLQQSTFSRHLLPV